MKMKSSVSNSEILAVILWSHLMNWSLILLRSLSIQILSALSLQNYRTLRNVKKVSHTSHPDLVQKNKTNNKGETMSDGEMIIQVVKSMSAAMGEGNLQSVMNTYEKGASLVAEPGTTVTGEAFLKAMEGYVSMNPKFHMPEHEVIISGDIALHIGPWTMEAQDPSTGQQIEQKGLSLAVFRRQTDGRWLMVIDNPFGDHLLSK